MKYKVYFYSTAYDSWIITAIDINSTDAIQRCQQLRSEGVKCYILQEESEKYLVPPNERSTHQ